MIWPGLAWRMGRRGESERDGMKIYPPVYIMAALLMMVGLHYTVPVWQYVRYPYNLVGLLPIALGLGVGVWARWCFWRAGTTIFPFSRSSAVVTGGPYRFTRHPMYVGMTVSVLGVAILWGSLTPLLGVAFFAAVITTRFMPREERELEEQFGEPYREYCRRVRRWL